MRRHPTADITRLAARQPSLPDWPRARKPCHRGLRQPIRSRRRRARPPDDRRTETGDIAAGHFAQSIHRLLHDAGHFLVERVDRLARLEIGVGIVRRAAYHGMFGRQGAGAMGAHQIVVDHRPYLLVRDQRRLVLFVGSPEAVEKEDDRHARFQRRHLRDQGEIMRFLDGRTRKHGESRHPGAHDVGMVTKDGQRLCCDRPRSHVENARRQFSRDLVHVGKHQQEALRGRKRRCQRAALERTMKGACGSPLGLHLLNDRCAAPDVLDAFRSPGIRQFGHRRGRGDRKNRADFINAIGDMGGGRIAVHNSSLCGHIQSTPLLRAAFQARTLKLAGIVGSPIKPVFVDPTGSGVISIAWHGHCSKQTAQPLHRS